MCLAFFGSVDKWVRHMNLTFESKRSRQITFIQDILGELAELAYSGGLENR